MRFALGLLMALFCGIQLAILSLPFAALLFPSRGPRDEFSGLAMLGGMMLLGGAALAIGFTGGGLLVLLFYGERTKPRFARVVIALSMSIGVFASILVLLKNADSGILWAVGASALVLVIGLPIALLRPYRPEKRWRED